MHHMYILYYFFLVYCKIKRNIWDSRQMVFDISSTSCMDIDRWIEYEDYEYGDCKDDNEDVVEHFGKFNT